jgi:hypothetical protein
MGIKNIQITFFFLLFFSISLIITPITLSSNEEISVIPKSEELQEIKSSSLALIDKVYTFNASSDELKLNLNLERKFDYYIYVEVVTPNNTCNLAITIWDPESKIFNIFQRDMISDHHQGDYDEVPFGTTLSGIHQIKFSMTSTASVNLYIRIEKVVMCLYDKISTHYLDRMLFYEVKRFSDGATAKISAILETDAMYRLYIGRVSAIADISSIEKIDINITDANNVQFLIYEDVLLPDVSDMFWTFFGTAVSGLYDINLKIYCTEPYVNIAYVLSYDYDISDIIDGNESQQETLEKPEDSAFLPQEWTLGTLIFAGSIAGVLTIVFIQQRKKNAVNLDLNDKRR